MCDFFSFTTDPVHYPGQRFYFDWNYRKNHLDKDCDSHTQIAEHFSLDEDKHNKYEYNPLTKKFVVDQINSSEDDRLIVEKWVSQVNFSRIVEPLIVKPIVYPFSLPKREITRDEVLLLKEWAAVRPAVGDAVRPAVGVAVGVAVGDAAWDVVGDAVRPAVRAAVRVAVGAAVWDVVWDTVGAAVRVAVGAAVGDAVRAYISSFFDIDYEYDFSSCVKLWEMGIVPSFDGKTWRLHSGERADIVFEISKEDLEQYE